MLLPHWLTLISSCLFWAQSRSDWRVRAQNSWVMPPTDGGGQGMWAYLNLASAETSSLLLTNKQTLAVVRELRLSTDPADLQTTCTRNAILPVSSTFVLSWLRQGPHLTWKKSLPSASGLGTQTSHGSVSRAMWVWSMSAFESSGGWCHKTLHLDLQRSGIKLSTCPHNWSEPESACTEQTMLRSLHVFWILMLVAITLVLILILLKNKIIWLNEGKHQCHLGGSARWGQRLPQLWSLDPPQS